MKIAIIYSSKTGNTQKIAETIYDEVKENADIFSVEKAPPLDNYDILFIGGWVDKGEIDAKARDYLHSVSHANVALFMTLGAYPDSTHAKESMENMIRTLGDGCSTLDTFICQGAIAPKLIEWMKTLPPEHPHAPDDARIARWEEAGKHPNEDDYQKARCFAQNAIKRYVKSHV